MCHRQKVKERKAQSRKTSVVDTRFWSPDNKSACRTCRASSVAVELTAYMVQVLLLQGRLEEARPSVKWLGSQRNSMGGFVSTQDTVVALQALAMYSREVASDPTNMLVKVIRQDKAVYMKVREDNKLLLQVRCCS